MEEIGKARQQAIARLIRKWISSDTNRRQLRQLLDLPTDADLPIEHMSLLDELDRGATKKRPAGGLPRKTDS
jgi:hypothetical protein